MPSAGTELRLVVVGYPSGVYCRNRQEGEVDHVVLKEGRTGRVRLLSDGLQ